MFRAIPILLLFALLAMLGLGLGCRPQSSSPPPDPLVGAVAPTAAEVADFTNQSRIPLPSLAQTVRYHAEGGIDSAVWLQFRLPATDLPKFVASIPVPAAEVHKSTENKFQAEDTLSTFHAWIPAPPKKFQYVDTSIAPGRYVKCLFDLDDPKTVTVYLMWFTT